MDNLDAIVGQRVEPALTGENTTLTTYVGSARYHFLAIGDANYAPNITRFGLQATIAGAVRGFQSSQALSPREKLTDTFTAARNAVEAARTENQYTSPTGAALTVAIVHPEGVCVGRMGGGVSIFSWAGSFTPSLRVQVCPTSAAVLRSQKLASTFPP
jgi:hypothetical protein